jgi:hypothetical protein
MQALQDMLKTNTGKATLGVGVALVAFAALPAIISAGRPIAKIAIKSGLLLLERSREALAEAGEDIEDMVAEVKSELAGESVGFSVATEETVLGADEASEA